MKHSIVTSSGDGTTKNFDVPFPYLRKEHVKAYVDNVSAPFSWINGSRIEFLTAPAAGSKVDRRRETPANPIHTIQNNKPVPAQTYNEMLLQAMFYAQEQADTALTEEIYGVWDAALKRISRVGMPVDNYDAANKKYVAEEVARAVALPGVVEAILAQAEAAALRAENAVTDANLPPLTPGSPERLLIPKSDGSAYDLRIPTYAPNPSDASIQRELYAKLRERISVLDFRLTTDTNWTQTFNRAIDYIKSIGGGRLYVPAGTYDMGAELVIKPASYWHNLILEGDGSGSTILDFQNAPAGTDGLCVEKNIAIHGRIGLRGFSIVNSKGTGLHLNRSGGVSFLCQYFVEDIRCDASVGAGAIWYNTYMGSHVGLFLQNGQGTGGVFQGFHTSLSFMRCWAGGDGLNPSGGNALAGWDISNVTSSAFYQCGADWNGLMGWRFRNLYGLKLVACGAESNGQEAFLVDTTTGPVRLSLDNVVAAHNGKTAAGVYASLLGVKTGGSNSAAVDLALPTSIRERVGDPDIAVNGASGVVDLNYDDPAGGLTIARAGVYRLKNRAVVGRTLIAELASNQSAANNATVALNVAVIPSNSLEGYLSAGAVVLPSGVNRVKITGSVMWADDSTGARYLELNKNGSAAAGLPAQKTVANGITTVSTQSAVIEVDPAGGTSVGAAIFQNSGGALDALATPRTFLAVEAVG